MSQTIVRAGIHGAGRKVLNKALANYQPFTTSGALSAKVCDGYGGSLGALQGDERERLLSDWRDVVYVVLSYATPIYWRTRDGRNHYVQQRFSATTSRHQSIVRAGIPSN